MVEATGLVKSLFGGRVGETETERSGDPCATGKQPVENQPLLTVRMVRSASDPWTPLIAGSLPSLGNVGCLCNS